MSRIYRMLTTIVVIATALFTAVQIGTSNIIATILLFLFAITFFYVRHIDEDDEDDDTDGYDLEGYI